MAYQHGVYISESETALRPPVQVSSALPVVFGTAPIHMLDDPEQAINKVVLASSYAEAVERLGFANAYMGKFRYTLSEFTQSHFALFGASPVVFVNVLGSRPEHKLADTFNDVVVERGVASIGVDGVIKKSLVVKNEAGDTTFVEGEDYTIVYDRHGFATIAVIDGGAINEGDKLSGSFDQYDPEEVDELDIIGGVDPTTLELTGIELTDNVFTRTRLVPGTLVAPRYSGNPAVAAVLDAKASLIVGHFKALALVDVPATIKRYSDVPEWKNDNNIAGAHTVVCWPALSLGGTYYNYSTQLAGLIARTDDASGGTPYLSPSNRGLQMDSAVVIGDDGVEEVVVPPNIGAYLNGQGIMTVNNFASGWVAWGNETAAFPGTTDPILSLIPIRRMFNWIGNTLTLSNWQNIDAPLNRKQIQTVASSNGQWINSLTSSGALLGGSVEFLEEDNPDIKLMAGESLFRVEATPPSPNRVIRFELNYEPSYLQAIFE